MRRNVIYFGNSHTRGKKPEDSIVLKIYSITNIIGTNK